MGREIRNVPPNYQHELSTCEHWPRCQADGRHFQPKYERNYNKACIAWYEAAASFEPNADCSFYHEYESNPPNKKYYLEYDPDDKQLCTWFQLYETVSEGTPASPAFATKEELADYLAENGDYWDQRRRKEGKSIMDCSPWGKESAYKFVFGR